MELENRKVAEIAAARKRDQALNMPIMELEDIEHSGDGINIRNAAAGAHGLAGGAGQFLALQHYPTAKNFGFELAQARGDDYGEAVGVAEKDAWRLAHEYNDVATGMDSEKTFATQDTTDWLHDLRVRFREPLKFDAEELAVLVRCQVLGG